MTGGRAAGDGRLARLSRAARAVGPALRLGWRASVRAGLRFNAHDGSAMAGYVAYAAFLSIFPFAIFATALAGQLIGVERTDEVVEALFDLAPEHVAQTLEPVIRGVTAGTGGNLITISILGALWVASNAVEAIRVAFDRAYGVETPRNFFARRMRGLGVVVLAAATFAVMGLAIVLAPLALRLAEEATGVAAPFGVGLLRYALGVGVLALFLFQLNLVMPSRRPKRDRLWPGVAVSAALLALGATGLSVYLSYAPSYTLTYGAFAGVIVTLLFFYLGGAAIIFGAEINAALEALRDGERT